MVDPRAPRGTPCASAWSDASVSTARATWCVLWSALAACGGEGAPPSANGPEPAAAAWPPRAGGPDGGREEPRASPPDGGREAASSRDGEAPAAPPPALDLVERVTAGADPARSLPLLVALHGLGDRPESFAESLRGLGVPARIVAPRPRDRFGLGYSWGETTMRGRAPRLEASARRVVALAAEVAASRPTAGRPVVFGYSQGGVVAYLVSARRPAGIAAVLAVAGALPPEVGRLGAGDGPPLLAFHGERDPVTAAVHARRSVARLRGAGLGARLRVYEGVGHGISGRMRADLGAALESLLASAGDEAPADGLYPCEPCPGRTVAPGSCELCEP